LYGLYISLVSGWVFPEAEPVASTNCKQYIWEETSGNTGSQSKVCIEQAVVSWNRTHLRIVSARGREAGAYPPAAFTIG